MITTDVEGDLKEGFFIDCPVSGVHYQVGLLSGSTSGIGGFPYYEGNKVSLYIGDVLLGQVTAKERITPIDLAEGAQDETHPTVTNICRLLQSLDNDMNLDNGIYISLNTHLELEGVAINFDQEPDQFGNDPNVIALFDSLNGTEYIPGNPKRYLCTAEQAQNHFRATLTNLDKAGYDLSTDLEPGFPVGIPGFNGTYQGGAAISILIGDIDGDLREEILVSGLAAGPLYALRFDGSLAQVFGSPQGVVYPTLGNLSAGSVGLDVIFGGFFIDQIVACDGAGSVLPGWPINNSNYVSSPPTLVDIDNQGTDEIFINEEDGSLHAYRSDGTILPGWPVETIVGYPWHQYFSNPAVGDIDNDGQIEIVAANGGGVMYAINPDGTLVDGFPVSFPGNVNAYPAVGDVDGDGNYEIIVGGFNNFDYEDGGSAIVIISNSGAIKYTIDLSFHKVAYGSPPVLADLNNDGIPEIIYQTEAYLFVFEFDGNTFQPFPGWPQRLSTIDNPFKGHSSPVVGDIDGDNIQEIVVTVKNSGTIGYPIDEIRAYEINGLLHNRFPKIGALMGGGTPAISDIDLDGRNEIIIRGDTDIYNPQIWVYDLGGVNHGDIEWGQYGRDYRHTSLYPK